MEAGVSSGVGVGAAVGHGTGYGAGSNGEYGNPFDVMGGGYGFAAQYNTISKRALGWLQHAVDAGWNDLRQLSSDHDLASLWNDARFHQLRTRLGG